MDKLTIGLILPQSTVLPVAKDFESGVMSGLSAEAREAVSVDVAKEFSGQGGHRQLDEITSRFFNYHEADVVAGVLSGRMAEDLAERFQVKGVPLVVANVGGFAPRVDMLNDHIFINTLHLWRHAWTMGYQGVKNFGKKGMYVSSVYDAGYSFSQFFYEGMLAAEPTAQWSFAVAPMPPNGQLTDMQLFPGVLEQFNPDFIFATFCGGETELFLKQLEQSGWLDRLKITSLPFLAAPAAAVDCQLFSTLAFGDTEKPAEKSFYHLGYEIGEEIGRAALKSRNRSELQANLLASRRFFNTAYDNSDENRLVTANYQLGINQKMALVNPGDVAETFPLDHDSLRSKTGESSFGWMNPYLCV
jgi:branched-chain amino acid transport system substrate-binding protein